MRVIRDYSYCSDRFYGPGYLLAGDAACFIDPVFSTGVHLACLSGYLAAQTVESLRRGAERRRSPRTWRSYDARYRAAFERYLQFLYFFYDHHADPDSYFWTGAQDSQSRDAARSAHRIRPPDVGHRRSARQRHRAEPPSSRRVTLDCSKQPIVDRFSTAPDATLFRVRQTLNDLDGLRRKK